MVILPEVTENEAIQYAVKHCSQNSTPADVFCFDDKVPALTLKYGAVVTHYVKFTFSALVEARPKTDDDSVDRRFMDRYNSESCVVAFASTGCAVTPEEKFWPSEDIDVDIIISEHEDPKIQGNPLISGALNICCANLDVDNAQVPSTKLEVFIKEMIDRELSEHYSSEFYFSVKDTNYNIISDSHSVDLLFFPYYEFSFSYENVPYTVKIAAHNRTESSKGFFGGTKAVVDGALPRFVSEDGGLFAKLKARKERKNGKEEQRDYFLRNVAPKIRATY